MRALSPKSIPRAREPPTVYTFLTNSLCMCLRFRRGTMGATTCDRRHADVSAGAHGRRLQGLSVRVRWRGGLQRGLRDAALGVPGAQQLVAQGARPEGGVCAERAARTHRPRLRGRHDRLRWLPGPQRLVQRALGLRLQLVINILDIKNKFENYNYETSFHQKFPRNIENMIFFNFYH
jgi:hypothetical protein